MKTTVQIQLEKDLQKGDLSIEGHKLSYLKAINANLENLVLVSTSMGGVPSEILAQIYGKDHESPAPERGTGELASGKGRLPPIPKG